MKIDFYHCALLFACGLSLALVIAYAFWVKIRVLKLQANALTIAARLRSAAHRLECREDPAYVFGWQRVLALCDFAPMLSGPSVVYLIVTSRLWPSSVAPSSKNIEMQEAIEKANAEIGHLFFRFITHDLLTGWFIRAILLFVPKRVVSRQAEEAADRTLKPVE